MGSKKILVTGGAGFIGSHLCDRLLNEDCHVVCVDNFYTGSKKNVEHLLNKPKFRLLEHDIINPLSLEVDEIYNFACPASPIHYQKNPVQTVKTCVLGTLNMLFLAQKIGAKILHASTSEVYGDPEQHPQTEAYRGSVNPIGPRACYDEGKRCAETVCFDYRRLYGTKIKVIRIFNTYGPRMLPNDGRVISNFIIQALQNKPITIYGDGSQTRSFCYVDDLLDAIVTFMTTDLSIMGPVNLGNPAEMTIKELAEKIIEYTGSKAELKFCPLPEDDPKMRKPDISYAKAVINWQPKVDLETGLRQTINYFRGIA